MPRSKEYKVVGSAPIVVGGEYHYPGETFKTDEDMGYMALVGAVELVKGESKKED